MKGEVMEMMILIMQKAEPRLVKEKNVSLQSKQNTHLLGTDAEAVIRVVKNLRVCWDCHAAINMRDNNRFHCCSDGETFKLNGWSCKVVTPIPKIQKEVKITGRKDEIISFSIVSREQ
ncbi:unnamed protein product [Malus baccata var. baccata]